MSVEAVQARMAEITSRISQLGIPLAASAPAAVATPSSVGASTSTLPSPTSGSAFDDQLQQMLAAGASTAVGAGAGATATSNRADAASSSLAEEVIASAKEHLGVPYLWGGTTPKGFDCSGLIQYVFKQHGISLPRVSRDQARAGVAVTPAEAQPGDLVAFDNSRSRAGIDHIGIYLGGGKWIAAPRTGDVVKIQDVDLSKAVAIRRVLPSTTARAASVGDPAPLSSWASALPVSGQRFAAAFEQAGQATGVDPRLLASVAWTESSFNPSAVSRAGAEGLMQIMPATARGLGVDASDPQQAALGAARHLAENLRKFDGRLDLALAAYNAGPGAVRKHGGIPPYAETRAYVAKVLDRFTTLGGQS